MTVPRYRRVLGMSAGVILAVAPQLAAADGAGTGGDELAASEDGTGAIAARAPDGATVGGAAAVAAGAVSASPKDDPSAPIASFDPTANPVAGEPASRAAPVSPAALPSGADKSGVTSKSISVPKGAGTIQGMDESFSAQLSTGIATFNVPIALPPARGGAQPSLSLSYSSSSGAGVAGMGWSIGVPFIARQTDRGVPGYGDETSWHAEQDRFVFNGGQELVPICTVSLGGACSGALPGEAMPVWASGWQYFRPRVEGSFLRFYWSPDHRTWRVQDKSGVTMELGVPLDGSNLTEGLERNSQQPAEIFRWHLTRQYDTFGAANPATGSPAPRNVVVYRYAQDAGMAYLTDVYATPPGPSGGDGAINAPPLATFAQHARLVYEHRSDPTISYRSGWGIEQRLRLVRIDVAVKPFGGTGGSAAPRRMLRRIHLSYDPSSHLSLLSSVQVEGRCVAGTGAGGPSAFGGVGETEAHLEQNDVLPGTNCPRLPPMTFAYSRVTPYTTGGALASTTLPGYEGFDARLIDIAQSPPHSVDEEQTDLFDVNSDGLPDALVTAAGLYGSGHGVFFNGALGLADRFGPATPMSVTGGLGGGAGTLTLKNPNVAPLDLDGDGVIDLLHMPQAKTYAVHEPRHTAAGWTWFGRAVTTANQLSPKIDFGKDVLETRVMDVDFDGLVDVVVTTGTEVQTFFSLGRYPGGDGQFGRASWSGPSSADLSNEPVRTCVPWSATPVRFSDPDIKLADMNGDGITDIVRIRKGDVRYWPGRGNGFWGTGSREDCLAGTFGANRHIMMAAGPQYSDVQGESLRLDDVNGDGLADLVQIRFTDVDVWLNVDGAGWTERHVIKGTPASPSYANRVRLVDVNGSGTRDVLWGNAGKYQYMDLAGGQRPHLLTRVDNGLGKTTHLEYSTSTAQMLAAEVAGKPWSSKMPTVAHVVTRVTETDNHAVAGKPAGLYVTEYTYRDPVFEGRQREFRGFRSAQARRLGDENSPTDVTETTFLLGECVDETTAATGSDNFVDDCAVEQRWRDNPREALKGLPLISEQRDEAGRVLSTVATGYRLRRLYIGLDGREVRHAFESETHSYLYDSDDFVAASSQVSLPLVQVERAPAVDGSGVPPPATSGAWSIESKAVPLRSAQGRARLGSAAQVDVFGNRVKAIARGCVEGCPAGVDETITTVSDPIRPAGDPTGWLWRTGRAFVEGSQYSVAGVAALNETVTEYSPQGVPIKATQKLAGTLPLTRSHATGGAVALPPASASAGGDIVWHTEYDGFGNVVREHGPNGRCREVSFDTAFAQLAVEERQFKAGCGSAAPLVSRVEVWDRGFALATDVRDMQSQPTVAAYDGFGRLVTLHRPHPLAPGIVSPEPSVIVEYFLPPDLGAAGTVFHSVIHTRTQDGSDPSDQQYLESYTFVDGLGRTLVTLSEADPVADGAPWIASEQVAFDAKGAVERKHLASFYTGPPLAFPFGAAPASHYGTLRYDAFGRAKVTTDLDGTVTLYSVYHALSTDHWDAADLGPQPHAGTFATETKDGHGRLALATERFHEGAVLRARVTQTNYLPTGEPRVITRTLGGTGQAVTRWMRYDTQSRLVLNLEPNTTKGFSSDPNLDPTTPGFAAWRYTYNDAGDLVGTSDARGCGVNFDYDGLGRLLSEDYSPCEGGHAPYSTPDLATRSGIEVLYHYDTLPPAADIPPSYAQIAPFVVGRLVATYDRASLSVSTFDGRGRSTALATRVARPGPANDLLDARYAPRWYERAMAFDAADREVAATTGATRAELQGVPISLGGSSPASTSTSAVTTNYTARGTIGGVGGSYGALVGSIKRSADGLLESMVYGDAAGTRTDYSYDLRRRVSTIQTYRGPPPHWTSPPANYVPSPSFPSNHQPSFQLLLQDDSFKYDIVSNPIEIRDWRIADEWPTGAKPVTKKAQYDDLYRLKRLDYQHTDGADDWTAPFDAENKGDDDPRRAKPSPNVSFEKRVQTQTWSYDWLGNTSQTDDDAHGFYDRSLGTITNDTSKPYQLTAATNTALGGPRTGSLSAQYDDAGNLVQLTVTRAGPCLPAGANCNQRFEYTWDEVGRLVEARRFDGPPPAGDVIPTPAVTLRYAYDAGDQRVLKTAVDPATSAERHTVYIFETLELRRAAWTTAGGPADTFDYELTQWTEVPYLFANGVRLARLAYEDVDVPSIGATHLHVFFELGDHLGSTSVVLDKATSELVERATFEGYGARESDYRPERWGGFREDYGFTGKEDDVEVGLAYFGKRYLSTSLNRWISADPLTVHALGGDLNAYAYVSGQALRAIDPLGLDGEDQTAQDAAQKIYEDAMHAAWMAGKAAEDAAREQHESRSTAQKVAGAVSAAADTYMGEKLDDATAKAATLFPAVVVIQRAGAISDAVKSARADPKAAARAVVEARVSSQVTQLGSDAKALVDATLSGDPENIAAATARLQVGNERRAEEAAIATGSVVTGGSLGSSASSGASGPTSVAAKGGGGAIVRQGQLLNTVDDILANPNLLKGFKPQDVMLRLQGRIPAGWRIEALGKGAHKGQGWVLRQYTSKGAPTGRQLRWHPGGGHHGPDPYWRVIDASTKSGIIR